MARDRTTLLGMLAAVVAASLFGTLGPLSRFAADAGIGGVAFTAWRAILGVAFLALLIVARGTARPSAAAILALSRTGTAALAVAAVMGVAINVSMFSAFGLLPIALALMLFYTYPAGVVVVDLALGREQMTATRLLALALSFAGVVLVLAGGMSGTAGVPLPIVGILLGLAASASQVVFVTVSRGGYTTVPADAATLVILVASAVGGVLVAAAAGRGADLLAPFGDPEAWLVLVAAGVAAAGISSVLFLTAIRLIGGTRTGILMLLEPVVGVLLASWLLGESLAPVQALGAVLVLAGALVLQVRSAPEREPIAETDAGPVV